jgi:hypothetical protein
MYVIIRFHVKEDMEHNIDVVNSFEDLAHYCDVLLRNDLTLKRVQPLIQVKRAGRCVPMAFNSNYEYYIQYHPVVTEPSFQ